MNIRIADRTLCREDGAFSFKEKLEIARQLEKLCVDTVELPKIENVKSDVLLIRTMASFVKNSEISVGCMTAEDIDNAASAISQARYGKIRIELPVSTVGMEYICHKKAPKMLETVKELVAYAKQKCNNVEFCAIDATRAEKEVLFDMIAAATEAGATAITVCDTAAEMMPDSFALFAKEIKEKMKG